MDEAKAINKIIVNLPKEKVDFINDTHQKELNYWKKIALKGRNKDENKQLTDLAPLGAFLVCKDVEKNKKNVDEVIFYLKSAVSTAQSRAKNNFEDVPSQEDQFIFETISARLKLFSRSTREAENTTLKSKVLLGPWVSTAAKVFRRQKNRGKDFPGRFEDCMERECCIKK